MGQPQYRFSGHESFSCRYAWIPKAVESLQKEPCLFSDIDHAMVRLGLGKNMVRSLRFWIQAMRVADPAPDGGLQLTDFGIAAAEASLFNANLLGARDDFARGGIDADFLNELAEALEVIDDEINEIPAINRDQAVQFYVQAQFLFSTNADCPS